MTIQKLLQAVEIINKTDPDGFIATEHDQIWIGSSALTSVEDRDTLNALGWRDEQDSWTHFC